MLLPRLKPPLRAAISSIGRVGSSTQPQAALNEIFAQLRLCRAGTGFGNARHASHKAQGAVNKAKDGPGKRLGAKKSGEQYVIPGNIIFRQRGTHWFAGENCGMGRDHTIYARECGYVKYYKDPDRHPKRQYIGVVFERDHVLPLPRNAARRRRLGMVAAKMDLLHGSPGGAAADADTAAAEESDVQTHVQIGEVEGAVDDGKEVVEAVAAPAVAPVRAKAKKERRGEEGRNLQLRPGYQYREGNWEIGRAAERANVKVRAFRPGDRWAAWRKTVLKRARNAERKGLNRKTKNK